MTYAYSSQVPLSAGITKGKSAQPISSTSVSQTAVDSSEQEHGPIYCQHWTTAKSDKSSKKQLQYFTRKTRWQRTRKAVGFIAAKPKRELKSPCPDHLLFQTSHLHPLAAMKYKNMKYRGKRGKKRIKGGVSVYGTTLCSFFLFPPFFPPQEYFHQHAAYQHNWNKTVSGKQPFYNVSI